MVPLVDIISLSLDLGVYTEDLKEAVVVPLLKKLTLDPLNLSNYYPVLNLLFLGKIESTIAV